MTMLLISSYRRDTALPKISTVGPTQGKSTSHSTLLKWPHTLKDRTSPLELSRWMEWRSYHRSNQPNLPLTSQIMIHAISLLLRQRKKESISQINNPRKAWTTSLVREILRSKAGSSGRRDQWRARSGTKNKSSQEAQQRWTLLT